MCCEETPAGFEFSAPMVVVGVDVDVDAMRCLRDVAGRSRKAGLAERQAR
jgi:hypothetical protein